MSRVLISSVTKWWSLFFFPSCLSPWRRISFKLLEINIPVRSVALRPLPKIWYCLLFLHSRVVSYSAFSMSSVTNKAWGRWLVVLNELPLFAATKCSEVLSWWLAVTVRTESTVLQRTHANPITRDMGISVESFKCSIKKNKVKSEVQVQVTFRPTVSRPVCLGVGPSTVAQYQIFIKRVPGYRTDMYCASCEVPIYICYVEESRPPLWSSGQSSWLQNGDVLCFLWGMNWIYICYVEESRPPLWSSGQSSWLQI
jgi:hypothetical protein